MWARMIKCWEVYNCRKVECAAYGREDLRCWLIATHKCPNQKETVADKLLFCLHCKVFALNVEYDDLAKSETLQRLIEKLDEYHQIIQTYQNIGEAEDGYLFELSDGVLLVPLLIAFNAKHLEYLVNVLPNIIEEKSINKVLLYVEKLVIQDNTVECIDKLIKSIELMGSTPQLVGVNPQLAEVAVKNHYDWQNIKTYRNIKEALSASS